MISKFAVCMLRGAPVVGKSTIGCSLMENFHNSAVVEVDHFRKMLAGCDWQNRLHHKIGMNAALKTVLSFQKDGVTPVILIDTFGRDRLPQAQEVLDKASLSHITFSLWLEPAILQERLRHRKNDYADWKQTQYLNEESRTIRFPNEQLIDTTKHTLESLVQFIIRNLAEDTVVPLASKLDLVDNSLHTSDRFKKNGYSK